MFGLKKKGIELLLRGELLEFIEDEFGESEDVIPVSDSKMLMHFIPYEESPVLFTTGLSFFEQKNEEIGEDLNRIELIAFFPQGTTFEEICDGAYDYVTDFMVGCYVDLEQGGTIVEGMVIYSDEETENEEEGPCSWALRRAEMEPSICKSDFVGKVEFLEVIPMTDEEKELYLADKMSFEETSLGLPAAHRLRIINLFEDEFGETTEFYKKSEALGASDPAELIIYYIPGDLCTILFTTGLSFVGLCDGEQEYRLELMAYLPQGISFEEITTSEEYKIFIDLMISSYERLFDGGSVLPGEIYYSKNDYRNGFDSAIVFLSLMEPDFCKGVLGKVDIFTIVPLYKTEREFFRDHGSVDPIQALVDNEISPLYDPHRKHMSLFDV